MAKVYFKHLRELEYCAPRIRTWCTRHGIPLRSFREGIDSSVLRETGCGLAIRAANLADNEDKPSEENT